MSKHRFQAVNHELPFVANTADGRAVELAAELVAQVVDYNLPGFGIVNPTDDPSPVHHMVHQNHRQLILNAARRAGGIRVVKKPFDDASLIDFEAKSLVHTDSRLHLDVQPHHQHPALYVRLHTAGMNGARVVLTTTATSYGGEAGDADLFDSRGRLLPWVPDERGYESGGSVRRGDELYALIEQGRYDPAYHG